MTFSITSATVVVVFDVRPDVSNAFVAVAAAAVVVVGFVIGTFLY